MMSTSMSLLDLRNHSRERSDMVNSTFVSDIELNSYINQSYFELYDLLINSYEDYYVFTPAYTFTTDGVNQLFPLPDGKTTVDVVTNQVVPAFYKLMGVDLGLDASSNAWVTLKKFEFIGRNRYVFPQLTTTYLGVFNLRYRLINNQIMFIPTPSSAQFIRLWYVPRLQTLVNDSDLADGISGWTEYIIVDAAIKMMQKEESDTTILMAQKMALIKRIEETAINRDIGQPDTISDVRSWSERWGTYGAPNGDGGYGGW